ncbi:alpha-hydroxy-acid oxidizing protein [Ameyamaea chiangmaiensis]|nr:alpha-hydroxy acid oxidase [Ameyamaea chiangmaiensis]MBS4075726.1 alpha-hydroxy-acid oxidizing protein [Ameyamaea chiangmaiensis]
MMPAPSLSSRFLCLADFEAAARRRLPRAAYAYLRNGAGEERSLRWNRQQFDAYRLVPRRLRPVSDLRTDVTLFGQRYALPFGIAPLGGAAVLAYDADRIMAACARAANIPYMLSANAITPLEDIIRINPAAWFAAYLPADTGVVDAMTDRVQDAGFPVLAVTVDVPVAARRLAETRAGYAMPVRATPQLVLDALRHPRWLIGTMGRTLRDTRHPAILNVLPTGGIGLFARGAGPIGGAADFDWGMIERLRARWRGALVLKGLLHPDDARRAAATGVDGIVASNHGARTLDGIVGPVEQLAAMREAAGRMTVLADSGFRGGTDVMIGQGLGADAVFLGRPFLMACVAAGLAGVDHAIGLLGADLRAAMAHCGVTRPEEIADAVVRRGPTG